MDKDNKNTELDNTDKKLHISDVIKRFNCEDEFLEILWKTKTWFEQNQTGVGGYSEKYCKKKLKSWVEENVL